MTERDATTHRSSEPGLPMWQKVIAFAMLPLTFVVLLLLSAAAIASLPLSYVYYLAIEPMRTRRHMRAQDRLIDEDECLSRLRRGEGSLIVHRANGAWLSGIQDRAWYTDDAIEAPSAPEAAPELDTLTDEQSRELGANIVLWNRLYRKYARTNWGASKLVRAGGAMAFVRRIRAECPGARVVSIVRWTHLLGPVTQCRACEYPLVDSVSLRCPECGKRNALPRPSRA